MFQEAFLVRKRCHLCGQMRRKEVSSSGTGALFAESLKTMENGRVLEWFKGEIRALVEARRYISSYDVFKIFQFFLVFLSLKKLCLVAKVVESRGGNVIFFWNIF